MTTTCLHEDCQREFLDNAAMIEHAEAVHSFDEIRVAVAYAVREKWGKTPTEKTPGTYTWIEALASDWVVFEVEGPTQGTLFKASYEIKDGDVSFGTPVEVMRRTVYEAKS